MLYVFGFTQLGVVLSDLYFVDPNPGPGQEGAERGVRVEVRFLSREERGGSIYASQPITVGEPIWRIDLLESVTNPGSLDRAHHHPRMTGWEPHQRTFDRELSADPVGWFGARLDDFASVLDESAVDCSAIDGAEIDRVRAAAPEILDAVRRLLKGVQDGDLAQAPSEVEAGGVVRASWL